jgi:peptidoglycan/xylan/chitin deacetylase (PgdA/CDA1 family)
MILSAGNSPVLSAPIASDPALVAPVSQPARVEKLKDEVLNQVLVDSLSYSGIYFSRPRLVTCLQNRKKVVLTFDDGPHPRTTPKILEILKSRNLKAIFFVLGMQAEKYPHLVKQIFAEGHEIGNHSYNHKNLAQLARPQIVEQIDKTSDIIEGITGSRPRLIRPPYGAINKQILAITGSRGMNVVMWTIDPKDWDSKNEAVIMRNMQKQLGLNSTPRGGVVLLHDIYPSTVRVLNTFLDQLAINEYQVCGVDDVDNDAANFWAVTAPKLLKDSRFYHPFKPEVSGHALLVKLLGKKFKPELSSMDMLKASRKGELLVLLANNNQY